MLLLIDNSRGEGEYSLKNYLKSLKIPLKIITDTTELHHYPNEMVQGIIFSGSTMLLTQKEHFFKFNSNISALLNYDCPKLGICFGFQVICMAFGGTLATLEDRFCQKQKIQLKKSHAFFDPLEFDGNFCCIDVLDKMPHGFTAIATSMIHDKERVVAIENEKYNCVGILFHPELDETTHYILDSFINKCKL